MQEFGEERKGGGRLHQWRGKCWTEPGEKYQTVKKKGRPESEKNLRTDEDGDLNCVALSSGTREVLEYSFGRILRRLKRIPVTQVRLHLLSEMNQ